MSLAVLPFRATGYRHHVRPLNRVVYCFLAMRSRTQKPRESEMNLFQKRLEGRPELASGFGSKLSHPAHQK